MSLTKPQLEKPFSEPSQLRWGVSALACFETLCQVLRNHSSGKRGKGRKWDTEAALGFLYEHELAFSNPVGIDRLSEKSAAEVVGQVSQDNGLWVWQLWGKCCQTSLVATLSSRVWISTGHISICHSFVEWKRAIRKQQWLREQPCQWEWRETLTTGTTGACLWLKGHLLLSIPKVKKEETLLQRVGIKIDQLSPSSTRSVPRHEITEPDCRLRNDPAGVVPGMKCHWCPVPSLFSHCPVSPNVSLPVWV